jgi:hypothetical protein
VSKQITIPESAEEILEGFEKWKAAMDAVSRLIKNINHALTEILYGKAIGSLSVKVGDRKWLIAIDKRGCILCDPTLENVSVSQLKIQDRFARAEDLAKLAQKLQDPEFIMLLITKAVGN